MRYLWLEENVVTQSNRGLVQEQRTADTDYGVEEAQTWDVKDREQGCYWRPYSCKQQTCGLWRGVALEQEKTGFKGNKENQEVPSNISKWHDIYRFRCNLEQQMNEGRAKV